MDDQDFDRKARELHANATRETPQAVQQRLRAALAAPRRNHHAWQPMVAFASVAALAIGGLLAQRPVAPVAAPLPDAPPSIAQIMAVQGAPAMPATEKSHSATAVTAAYDNDPEFYAWLGKDAPPVPKE